MLQNESVDEEDEHFEDIVEEENINEPSTKRRENKDDPQLAQGSDAATSDSDSPEEEDDSPMSRSEDDISDNDGELLMRYDEKDAEEPSVKKYLENGQQPRTTCKELLLPGGYNPRHREPCYW